MKRFLSANAPLYDAFLREAIAEEAELLDALCEGLQPTAADPELRQRILGGLTNDGRLACYVKPVAELLDVQLATAAQLLDRALDPQQFSTPLPGIGFLWVDGGPRTAEALRGFVRVAAGQSFPSHEHLGRESLLVLQGTLFDDSRQVQLGPGDLDVLPAGSTHAFRVPADSPDLLGLAVNEVGLRMLGKTVRSRPKIT